MNTVLIIDTCILCIYLKVPKMDTCGPSDDKWDYARVKEKIDREIAENSTLVLPMATLIESGNHIAQAPCNRFEVANALADIIKKVAMEEEPWVAFTFQNELWNKDNLMKLADTWPKLADSQISIGDATIKDVAEYYSAASYTVEILTGDKGLKAYEPINVAYVPRRRR